jgi:hypothetical protein
MKTINLYFDFEFTSLSPDAQPISIGIISDDNKKFYAEFTDFDINHCDEWVKENVLSKLYLKEKFCENARILAGDSWKCIANIIGIKFHLSEWLSQFSDYKIQFVCDCGTYDWYWMVQLLAEWEQIEDDKNGFDGNCPTCGTKGKESFSIGLPNLPSNVSPVPEDLNDLIARKQQISVREAFDLNREELVGNWDKLDEMNSGKKSYNLDQFPKHNALWDAKVIKQIYNKLI